MFVDDPAGLRRSFRRSLLGSALAGARDWRRRRLISARPMLLLFYGAAYVPAVAAAAGPGGRDRSSCSAPGFCTRRRSSTNLDRRLVGTTAIGLITNIALNILFIPRLGITGAAWATVIAEAVTVTLLCHAGASPAGGGRTSGVSMTARQQRTAAVLGVTLFLSYAYFYPAGGWNQNSALRADPRDPRAAHAADRRLSAAHRRPRVLARPLLHRQGARRVAAGARAGSGRASRLARRRRRSRVVPRHRVDVVRRGGRHVGDLHRDRRALCLLAVAALGRHQRRRAVRRDAPTASHRPPGPYATLFMGHGQTAGCLMIALVAADAPAATPGLRVCV